MLFYFVQIASGRLGQTVLSPLGSGTCSNPAETLARDFQSNTISPVVTASSPIRSPGHSSNSPSRQTKGECRGYHNNYLHFGTRGNGGTLVRTPQGTFSLTQSSFT